MKHHQLRVWHIPQVPGKAFNVEVENIEQAKLLLTVLADYDAFQFENRIKPDYCNVGGLEIFDDEWIEWENEEGDTINDLMKG